MKRLVTLLLMLVACNAMPEPEQPATSQVTDALRFACADYGFTDLDIQAFITDAEATRGQSIDKAPVIATTVEDCSRDPTPLPCENCLIAILDAVYGP